MNFTSTYFQYILLLIVFAPFSCADIFENVRSDSNLGNCLDYDLRRSPFLVKEDVHRPKTEFSKFHESIWTIRFPELGEFNSPIRCILIKDNARDRSDGYATVQSGGVNQRYVVIYVKSYHGRDIDFNIEIYGDASKWWSLFGYAGIET